ncbi:MAG: hypothetical protein AB7G75_19415 [Candidatus Binatia bacterium]
MDIKWCLFATALLFLRVATLDAQTLLNTPPALRPNFNLILIPTGVGSFDAQAWFGVDSITPTGSIYYNFTNTSGVWQYPNASISVVDLGTNTSTGPVSVLRAATPQYKNPSDNLYYKYLMYVGSQPALCDGKVGAFLLATFSNDGRTWTPPLQVTRIGGPSFPCWPGHSNTVPIQSASALRDPTTDNIYLVGLEGDISILSNSANFNSTLTYLATASRHNPTIITLSGPLSATNIFKPNCTACGTAHSYFVNMDMTYEASTGRLYLSRAYAYPFDAFLPYVTPCNPMPGVGGLKPKCEVGIATLQTRVQMYYQTIGPLSNIAAAMTGAWNLVGDWGNVSGYPNNSTGTCQQTPLVSGQSNYFNRDYGYLSFRKDGNGHFSMHPSGRLAFLGTAYNAQRTQGDECAVTGNEGIYYLWY